MFFIKAMRFQLVRCGAVVYNPKEKSTMGSREWFVNSRELWGKAQKVQHIVLFQAEHIIGWYRLKQQAYHPYSLFNQVVLYT